MNRIIRAIPFITVVAGLLYLLTGDVAASNSSATAKREVRQVALLENHEIVPLPPVRQASQTSSLNVDDPTLVTPLPPVESESFVSLQPLPPVTDEMVSLEPLPPVTDETVSLEPLAPETDEAVLLEPLPPVTDDATSIERGPEVLTVISDEVLDLPSLPVMVEEEDQAQDDDVFSLPVLPPIDVEESTNRQLEQLPSIITEQPTVDDNQVESDELPIRLPATEDARISPLPPLSSSSAAQQLAVPVEDALSAQTEESIETEPARLAMADPVDVIKPEVVRLPQVEDPRQQQAKRRRTRDLAARERLAGQFVQQGFQLGNRGAHFSARSEFIEALKLLAASADLAENSRTRSAALAAGLRAIEESDDFVPDRSIVESELDLSILVSSHRTPVLQDVDLERLSMIEARQRYYAFAQEQLAESAGPGRAGSMALYGLGRIAVEMGEKNTLSHPAASHKALVYHQAALASDAENYLAANELGVLLARFGQYEEAQVALNHSVRLHPEATTWRNLSAVNQRLGDEVLARQALGQAEAIDLAQRAKAARGSQNGDVRWKSPEEFARLSSRGTVR